MIVCPNCNHPNPDGASLCESCYTPLPAASTCSNCGAIVQSDAHFCGQCGFNLKSVAKKDLDLPSASVASRLASDVPETSASNSSSSSQPPVREEFSSESVVSAAKGAGYGSPAVTPASALSAAPPLPMSVATSQGPKTQLQQQSARLFHIRTETLLELPQHLSVIHLGKPNDRVPPDIDVSGFPDSDIVSRIHADIRVEGDTFYIEDSGSSNGTYINNSPLPSGNRHRLRSGDRISLGKGDRVSFLFQLA